MRKHKSPIITSYFASVLFSLLSQAALSASSEASMQDRQLDSLLNDHWEHTLHSNPIFATSLGRRDFDHLLPDTSLKAYEASVAKAREFSQRLEDIKISGLSADNKINHKLLSLQIANEIDASSFGGKYFIMNNRSGPHLSLTSMVGRLPFFVHADYQSYLKRLAAIPQYMKRSTARIRAGLDAGWSQACAPMQGYEKSIQAHLVDDVSSSTFMSPFANKPAVIEQGDFDSDKREAELIIKNQVIPAFAKFAEFYINEYAPKCRPKAGIDSLEGGADYYQHRIGVFTTTDRSADEVHQIGLREVARILAEMKEVMAEANFEGSFEEWLVYLRDTPKFYPKTAEERMQVVAAISKKMDGELPRLFGKLPRTPYGLKEIPLDIAEKTTTAYYQRPAGDGTRAGFYFVNTTLLDTRPLFQLEALSLHEAVPGHHLQIALSQELDLPNFRRYGGFTVFTEGWGLYAERLGLEAGFYQDPYTNFGRLSYEMWRACRLVVDTGLHSKGWTRQQAIDYMMKNSGLSLNNVTAEVDRYISWPGQALAYKTGEMKIRELRKRAEEELGNRFDVRSFHDKVLENGALPLSLLEDIVNAWIESEK